MVFKLNFSLKDFICLSLFCLLGAIELQGQNNASVVISTKKEFINGKECYIHKVLKGQTIYSISKAYQVSEDEIIAENPQVKQGLKVDSYLRIPIKKELINDKPSTSIIYHTVQKKETLYGIANKYKVTESSILSANPEAKAGLKEGMFLKIESSQKKPIEKTNPNNQNNNKQTITYKVLKGETLYGIAKKFSTTTSEIKLWNPSINESIKEGMLLTLVLNNNQIHKDYVADKTKIELKDTNKTVIKPILNYCDKPNFLSEYNVALMLPFYTDQAYKINTSAEKKEGNYKSFSYIQFYEGFLMAIDSVKKYGINIKLHVYDVNDDTVAFKDLLTLSEWNKMNLVFAPFNNNCIEILRRYTENKKIKMVTSQITNANNFNQYPYFFNIAPSVINQLNFVSKYFSTKYSAANFIVVHNGRENEKEFIDSLKLFLKNDLHNVNNFNDVQEVIYTTDGIAGLTKKMNAEKTNIILSMIHNDIFVADYVRKLSENLEKYTMVVVGMPSWRNFEHIEVEYFQKLQLHLFSNTFIDYNDTLVKEFVKEFRYKYKVEPDQFAFTGYDAGYFFLTALAKYGLDFENCLTRIQLEQIANSFKFEKNAKGTYENKHLTIFTYKDYQMIDVDKIPADTVEIPNK